VAAGQAAVDEQPVNRPVIVFPSAQADAKAAADYLEQERPGLSGLFYEELDDALQQIGQYPNAWAVFQKGFRRFVIQRFQYAIVYVVRRRQIDVIALWSCRRRPRQPTTRRTRSTLDTN
jgi:toxin ParE1/3/4